MDRFTQKNMAFRAGILCALGFTIFMLIDNQVAGIVSLVALIAMFLLRSFFQISVGCIMMILFCHSLRKTSGRSMTNRDDLLEE